MKYEFQFGNFGNTFKGIYIMENGNEISQVFLSNVNRISANVVKFVATS